MAAFRDSADRTWTVNLTVYEMAQVKSILKIDLWKLLDTGLGEVFDDPLTMVQVVYVLCSDEMEKRHVDERDFGRSLFGDALGRARAALIEAYTDFFADPEVRETIRKAFAMGETVRNHALALARTKLDSLNLDDLASPEPERNGSSGNGRASLESTPVISVSASLP